MRIIVLAALALFSVRAEPVEARDQKAAPATRPSTSSGRTEVGGQSPIDAERAFAADAQTLGQWTAFRKWSENLAIMFVPQLVEVHTYLKDKPDPPQAIDWWPITSYISCDGKLAVNTGGWRRVDGAVGYFSTVWERQPDGAWKWSVDSGDETKTMPVRPVKPTVVQATCRKQPMPFVVEPKPGRQVYMGYSVDTSLNWIVFSYPDGHRHFTVAIWDGQADKIVIRDEIAASPNK